MATSKSQVHLPEPEYAQPDFNSRAHKAWYHPDISNRVPAAASHILISADLLNKYSRIPPDQQLEHIHKIRDQAWDIRVYPCIGIGAFLDPQLRLDPLYPTIIETLRNGGTLIDVGTFIGHDLRRLAYDGDIPTDKLYGIDIVDWEAVGYDFFRDKDTFQGTFIQADILSGSLAEVRGTDSAKQQALARLTEDKADVVFISQVLHQWDWEGQVHAASNLAAGFSKVGTLIMGNQMGTTQGAREVGLDALDGAKAWRHDAQSIARMFEEDVAARTGTKWEAQARVKTVEEMGWTQDDVKWLDPGVCWLEFAAKRVA
ncbi:uncharacterized protein B0I36DRAFT_369209 [Microdochium trichocladiopsis]|uniref:Methyltransferase domain-containing protein n=1 Tax=Microdochium trichocladiopsis TaxID=1682393 RepID=A0A9P8XS61_9PEZI|nr:uncharacterized protein B0I36DRAFT_369209 [Microdochium trichocladiopsis]KAH7014230.1 hypothetical protein B0I36DRAFT_369209 [Microdochium trichocladiopsis]